MRPSDKSVLLISNGPSRTGQDNTLTSFSGSIPPDFLNKHKSWKVAVDSCGLHVMLKQPISSKYENHPSLIQITFENLNKVIIKHGLDGMSKFQLPMFENSLKLYVDREKSYTSESLAEDFEQQAEFDRTRHQRFDGVPFKYYQSLSTAIKFGHFESHSDEAIIKEERKSRTCVFINKRFKEGLKIQFSRLNNTGTGDFRTTDIDGELYYYFFNTEKQKDDPFYPYISIENDFPLKEPAIIQITTPDIEHNINSGIFCRSLCQFTLKQSEIKKFIHKEFKNREFSNVLNNCITRFSIEFVDEELNQLHLSQGLPSWVKLVFSPEMEHKRNVIISSEPNDLHPENVISNFCVELPRPIDFSLKDDPRVALTRVSFKNKWKLMPGLKLNVFIFNCKNHSFNNYKCPKDVGGPRNCEGIIEWCKNLLKKKISVNLVKEVNGHWSINFPEEKYIVILGRDLAQCLGLAYSHKKRQNLFINVKKNDDNSNIETEEEILSCVQIATDKYIRNMYEVRNSELPFKSTGDVAIYSGSKSSLYLNLPPREIELYPNELYIFFNVVKPWPVMGEYRELLKIVPIKQDEDDGNITVDFHRLEYHGLSVLHPRLLKFQIATVDGALIEPFDENYNMYMNLQFCFD
jgi:hypothetical protein